jgi:hypothetical protein
MKKRRPRPPPKPPNLAARALGSPIFGLKVVAPKKGYSRKLKHRKGSATDDPLSVVIPGEDD